MPAFAAKFLAGRPAGVTSTTKDGAGLLIAWSENGYSVSVQRDGAGKPLNLTAKKGFSTYSLRYLYDAGGSFQGVSGEPIPTVFESELVADASGLAGGGSGDGGVANVKSINGKSLSGTGDAGITAADVGAAPAVPVKPAVLTSRNIAASDNNTTIDCRGSAGVVLTIPAGLSPMPSFVVLCNGAGTSISFGVGVKSNGVSLPAAVSSTETLLVIPTSVTDDYKVSTGGVSYIPADTVPVSASRALTSLDAGKTLEATSSGVTITVPNGLTLKPGVVIQRHTSGTSIAFSGGATGNGATTTLSISGQMAAIVPTATQDVYRVGGVA